MPADFESVHNHHETTVLEVVAALGRQRPYLTRDMLADVACVALNRLPPRYIRHSVDYAFYLSESERSESHRAITEAVDFAVEFVQARVAMRARG